MMTRPLSAALVLLFVILGWSWSAVADDDDDGGFVSAPVTDLYVFGDSLSDSGNLFALTGGAAPLSPPYSNGRFSNGPVWVETLAPLLGLEGDFAATGNNRAVGGAFTGTGNVNGPSLEGTGILGQVASFEATGERIGRRDLVVVWGGANNYLFEPGATPYRVVGDLVEAVERLSDRGARRFLLPNLPLLGRTPLAMFSPGFDPDALNELSLAHNATLAWAAAELADEEDLAILVLDVETALNTLIDAGTVFVNVLTTCLGGPPAPVPSCPLVDGKIDGGAAGGTLFWDPIHPTTNAHALLAFQAYGLVTGAMGAADDEPDWLAMRQDD